MDTDNVALNAENSDGSLYGTVCALPGKAYKTVFGIY